MSDVEDSGQLFTHLSGQLGINLDAVAIISVNFPWGGEVIHLRQGRQEDFDKFQEILRQAWMKDPSAFQEGCEIEILLHVDE